MLQRVEITGDQEEIGAALHGQEAATRDVDTVCVEVLDRGTNGGLELDNRLAIISDLIVDDDIKLHPRLTRIIPRHDVLDRREVHPQVVGVEDLELVDGLDDTSLAPAYISEYNHKHLP